MRSVPPTLPAALCAYRSLAVAYLSSRIPYVLCKCNLADQRADRRGALIGTGRASSGKMES